uniref:Uncharacterized protein n=1 Tax=Setaria viridis TaxID=4556 RepID=A0A4U6VWY8_SETVI|nr:hypothetical protein SEVIR_2G254350v2 [Setaria viridis]
MWQSASVMRCSVTWTCLVSNLEVVKLAFCHKCATVAFRLYL